MPKKTVTKKAAAKRKSKRKADVPAGEPSADDLFKQLKLLHVRLINIQANVSIKGGKTPDKAQIVAAANIGLGAEQKNVHVNAVLDVLGRPDLNSDEGSQLNIHLEYQVVFQLNDVTPDQVQKVPNQLVRAGMFIIWPNFRETVLSLTSKMAIRPLILPMFVAGAAGVSLGGTEIKFLPLDGPPDSILERQATASGRVQGYH